MRIVALAAGVFMAGLVVLACRAGPAWGEAALMERQLPFSVALGGAQAAMQRCLEGDYRVVVTVVDPAGGVKATLRADGANPHLLEGAMRKAYTAAMLRISTVRMGEIVARSPGAAGLMAFDRMTALGGGLPIRVGEDVLGGIGVAGVPVGGAGGAGDEGCAQAGLERMTGLLQ